MSSSEERALWETVDTFYAAATHPTQWEDGFARLARMCGAEVAGMHLETRAPSTRERVHVVQRWSGLDPAFSAAYVEHYGREDPWAASAHALPAGSVKFGEELVARSTLGRSEFHNELTLRYGLDDLMAGVLVNTAEELVTVGIVSGRNVRFSKRHKLTLARLLPHLARAVAIGKRLLRSSQNDKRPFIEERLRCRYELTAAEARVAALIGQGLSPKDVALVLGTSWNTVRAQLCRVFAKTGAGRQTELARLVHGLESGARARVPAEARLANAIDLEEALRERYGLTRAETRVAVRVSRGMSAKQTAESLGSQWNTVRSQLRQIYAKTKTSGQADLTRLVLQLES